MTKLALSLLVILLASFTVSPAVADGQEGSAGLRAGQDLPGAFQTLAVTGPRAGMFYCPVCLTGLNPGVVVFFRLPEGAADEKPLAEQPLPNFLKKLDAALVARPDARMSGSAVLTTDGGYRQALETKTENADTGADALDEAITRRDALAAKLKDMGKGLGIKNLELGLGLSAADAKRYGINPDAEVSVILYTREVFVSQFVFMKQEELTAAATEKVVAAVDKVAAEAEALRRPKQK